VHFARLFAAVRVSEMPESKARWVIRQTLRSPRAFFEIRWSEPRL
jgi:hypothetical protein